MLPLFLSCKKEKHTAEASDQAVKLGRTDYSLAAILFTVAIPMLLGGWRSR